MKKITLQGFNAAAAALGLGVLTACTAPPRDNASLVLRSSLRQLTPGEINLAKSMFSNTIDYSRVYIKTSALPLRSKAFNGIIRFAPKDYSPDFSNASLSARKTFIHEMEHMRQEQSGIDLVSSAIGLFFEGGYHNAQGYNYGDVRQIDKFSNLNIEQKATLTEDFYWAREEFPTHVFQAHQDNNCSFQRDALKILKGHLPNLKTSPECE